MKRLHGIAACVLMVAAVAAVAQTYPNHPVKIMVGANAGGGTDIIARMLGDKFQAAMGQPFIVENKPGASNTIAADATRQSRAGWLHAPRRDEHRAGDCAASHQARVRHEQGPRARCADRGRAQRARRVAERAGDQRARPDRAREANPDKFAYGSSGVGSTQHLAGEAFNLAAGTKAVHVPYKGSAQALADLVGGQIQLDFDTTSSAMAFIKSGKVKALAVMSPKRTPELPDVPTLTEAGLPGRGNDDVVRPVRHRGDAEAGHRQALCGNDEGDQGSGSGQEAGGPRRRAG
jgi:hypothetical protein